MAEEDENTKAVTLYTRRDGEVKGPFPIGQIERWILLGRVHMSDEVSEDRQRWTKVEQRPDLIPEVMTLDLSIPENRERYEAAKRWADERRFHGDEESAGGERRQPENEELLAYRQTREEVITPPKRRLRGNLFLILTVVVLIGVSWVAIQWTPESTILLPDCGDSPAPGVVWDNCKLDGVEISGSNLSGAYIRNASLNGAVARDSLFMGANLQYSHFNLAQLMGANFSDANMVGVSLRDADLTGADLSRADLSYANLTDAVLSQTKLEGAKLDHAYWIDGTLCAKGSVGECK